MIAALLAEATLLPHWVPVRWIPQVSFLILLFGSLRGGMRTGIALGFVLGAGQSLFSAMPAGTVIAVYTVLGGAAGAARSFVFLESPLAQWLVPVGFGLLVEAAFFLMIPWDDEPLGLSDYMGMIRASNLPVSWLLSGAVYAFCDRRIFSQKKQ